MRTCTVMAGEVRSVMNETTFTQDAENVTYVLNFEPAEGGLELGAATWRRIPCRPSQAQFLDISIDPRKGLRGSWGRQLSGLTNAVRRSLYHFVRAGPRLDVPRELPRRLHLKEFRVVIERPKEHRGAVGVTNDNTNPATSSERLRTPWNLEFVTLSFSEVLGACVRQGYMSGLVDKVRLSLDGKGFQWTVTQMEDRDLRDEAERYGLWETQQFISDSLSE